METETILAELSKINSRLDEIDDVLQSLCRDMIALRKQTVEKRTQDKFATWPLESDLDVEEAEELENAKSNASDEWKYLNRAECRAKYIVDEIQEQR